MQVDIVNASSLEQINAVFDGEAPHYHPDEFWNTRIEEKRAFIAQIKNKPIGLLVYTIWWGNTPFLELVHIQDQYQRQGIATKLLNVAAHDIQSKKFKTLISSCEDFNKDSLTFHAALGFKKLNTLAFPHGEEQFFSIELETLI